MKYVEVVLPLPLDGLFTYAVADNQAAKVQVGCRVLVPLGKSKKYIGIVMHVVDEKPEFEVKPIIEVIDRQPILLHQQIRLCNGFPTTIFHRLAISIRLLCLPG